MRIYCSEKSNSWQRLTRLGLVALAAISLGLAGCSGDDSGNGNGNNGNDGPDAGPTADGGNGGDISTSEGNLTLDFSNSAVALPDLGEDHLWEGWIVGTAGATAKSTGRFNASEVGADGKISFQVDESLFVDRDRFVLTVEPVTNDDPGPSQTKYLSGEFSDSSAELDIRGVIGNFSDASGQFALKTPTSSSTDDENQGVWFIQADSGSPPTAGFSDLPSLKDKGWKYEGWVVDRSDSENPMPYSTGKFGTGDSNPTWEQADQDGAGEFAGSMSDNFPPRPGSDFVTAGEEGNGFDLKTGEWFVVLSVEPMPDNSDSKPFALKPFSAKIETDDDVNSTLSLDYNNDQLPGGKVTIDN